MCVGIRKKGPIRTNTSEFEYVDVQEPRGAVSLGEGRFPCSPNVVQNDVVIIKLDIASGYSAGVPIFGTTKCTKKVKQPQGMFTGEVRQRM